MIATPTSLLFIPCALSSTFTLSNYRFCFVPHTTIASTMKMGNNFKKWWHIWWRSVPLYMHYANHTSSFKQNHASVERDACRVGAQFEFVKHIFHYVLSQLNYRYMNSCKQFFIIRTTLVIRRTKEKSYFFHQKDKSCHWLRNQEGKEPLQWLFKDSSYCVLTRKPSKIIKITVDNQYDSRIAII